MESFKLVLPSNASHDHFPKNTSAYYQTYLHNPIQLEGKWEVAADSIYYSSNIEIAEENALLDIAFNHEEDILVNDMYAWQFKLRPDKTWPGYKGVKLPKAKTTFEFIDNLNSIDLFTKADRPLFQFTRDSMNRVTYTCNSPNFTFEISKPMTKAMGFDIHQSVFTGMGPYQGKIIKDKPIPENAHPYLHACFFHSQLVQREHLITLKYPGEKCDVTTLLKRWQERVIPHSESHMGKYPEKGESNLLISHLVKDKALILSAELSEAMGHKSLIRTQHRWGYRDFIFTERALHEHWYVEIYNMKMASVVKKHKQHVSLTFQPRRFSTVELMISYLNENVISLLKSKLNDKFHKEKHSFSLTKNKGRVSLTLGSWIQLSCTPNVSLMLGFDERQFNNGKHEGTFAPRNACSRVQRVLLLTDVIESMTYGNHRLQILQDYVHNVDGREDIIEKRFQPLTFVPVKRNYFDTISIQLMNEHHQQITAKDIKTVVVLHFQRLKQ